MTFLYLLWQIFMPFQIWWLIKVKSWKMLKHKNIQFQGEKSKFLNWKQKDFEIKIQFKNRLGKELSRQKSLLETKRDFSILSKKLVEKTYRQQELIKIIIAILPMNKYYTWVVYMVFFCGIDSTWDRPLWRHFACNLKK